MSVMEMNEIKNAIAGVEGKVEYNGGGILEIKDSTVIKNGSVIKSIQGGALTLSHHGSSVVETTEVPIAPIDVNKAFLVFSAHGYMSYSKDSNGYVNAILKNEAIEITSELMTATASKDLTVGITWQVVEFY